MNVSTTGTSEGREGGEGRGGEGGEGRGQQDTILFQACSLGSAHIPAWKGHPHLTQLREEGKEHFNTSSLWTGPLQSIKLVT